MFRPVPKGFIDLVNVSYVCKWILKNLCTILYTQFNYLTLPVTPFNYTIFLHKLTTDCNNEQGVYNVHGTTISYTELLYLKWHYKDGELDKLETFLFIRRYPGLEEYWVCSVLSIHQGVVSVNSREEIYAFMPLLKLTNQGCIFL